jgi:hypothetical protein
MDELDFSDFVTIKITKVAYMNEPSYWEMEVTDKDGRQIGSATGPSYYGITDFAQELVMRNGWHVFDANGKNYE